MLFCENVFFIYFALAYFLLLSYFVIPFRTFVMYDPNYGKDNENKFAFLFLHYFFSYIFYISFNLENFFFYWFFDTFLFFDELDQPTFELSDSELF